ncbi:GNAT family N-acetyltransferase [Pseudomonas sp. PS01303]|uniref:GNAT family N-acetyltransferase n=1 Tax=Pseudomonas sp. PS01303 TaxID=2991439 RepID=UPI002499C83A|nr:GNAT family N-acetyltransferase [Pseudomonas sp. PS01303]
MREVLKIDSIGALKSPVLCERAERAHGGRSQEFVMVVNMHEAGLLSYDDWSHQAVGFISEIFVLPEFRQQGIGALLLSYAENHALQLRCTHIRLKPYPLDQETDSERLVAWYTKNDYFQKPDEPEIMEKALTTMQA